MELEPLKTGAPEGAPVGTPTPTPDATAGRKRGRPPLNAEQREAAAKRRQVAKALERLKGAKSTDELYQRARELESGAPTSAGEKAPAPKAAEPEPVSSWPSKEAVAGMHPLALMLWGQVAEATKGTRYELKAREHDGQRMEPVAFLADATAPVLAKYVPAVASTPEAAMLAAVAMVFGPALLSHAKELITGTGKVQVQAGASSSSDTTAQKELRAA